MKFCIALALMWNIQNSVSQNITCRDKSGDQSCANYDLCAGEPLGLVDSIKYRYRNRVTKVCLDEETPGFNRIRIYHDLGLRIPIIAAVVLGQDELNQLGSTRQQDRGQFQVWSGISPLDQANDDDYDAARLRTPCVDYRLGRRGLQPHLYTPSWGNVDCARYPPTGKGTIHRGHLIADAYLLDPLNQITYFYVNAVPQFESFNVGKWMEYETKLRRWGQEICAGQLEARMYIMVGVIPSVHRTAGTRKTHAEWLGYYGFGKYDRVPPTVQFNNIKISSDLARDKSKWYRVNVPHAMWTAACCVANFDPNNNYMPRNISNIAFGGFNTPQRDEQKPRFGPVMNILRYFSNMRIRSTRQPFPSVPGCNINKNYKPGSFK